MTEPGARLIRNPDETHHRFSVPRPPVEPPSRDDRTQGMLLGSTVSRLATPLPFVSPTAASPAKKYSGRPLYADCLCPSL